MKKLLLLLAVTTMAVACQKDNSTDVQLLNEPTTEAQVTFDDLDAFIEEHKLEDTVGSSSKSVSISPDRFDTHIQQVTFDYPNGRVGTAIGTGINYLIADCEDVRIRTELLYGYERNIVPGRDAVDDQIDRITVRRSTFGKVELLVENLISGYNRVEFEGYVQVIVDNAPDIPARVTVNPERNCEEWIENVLSRIESDFSSISGGYSLGIQSVEDATYSFETNSSGNREFIATFSTKYPELNITISSSVDSENSISIASADDFPFIVYSSKTHLSDLSFDYGDIKEVWNFYNLASTNLYGETYLFAGVNWSISDPDGLGTSYLFSSGAGIVFGTSRSTTDISDGVISFGSSTVLGPNGPVGSASNTEDLENLLLSVLP